LSFVTISINFYKAPNLTKFGINILEFLTKFPKAPAAFALVFSSLSYNKFINKGTQGFK